MRAVLALFIPLVLLLSTAAGEDCNGLRCAEGAECINDKCRCKDESRYGFGDVVCYDTPAYICAVTCDPEVRSGDQSQPGSLSRSTLPDPCRYCLQFFCIRRKRGPNCYISFYGTNRKYKGKLYMATFEMYVKIASFEFCLKIASHVDHFGYPEPYNIIYKYSLNPLDPFIQGIPEDQSPVMVRETVDGFIHVACEECGVFARFRRYNHHERHYIVSGGVIVVDTTNFPDVDYEKEKSLCLPPSYVGPSLEDLSILYSIDLEFVSWHRVITADVHQPLGSSPCQSDLKKIMKGCKKYRNEAYVWSVFIYHNARFLKCFDTQDMFASDAVCLMKDIASAICTGDTGKCLNIQGDLSVFNKGDPCPDTDFLDFNCHSLPGV